MKQLLTIIALLVSINAQAQKIISHTTTIGKFADSSIELTERTNGTSYYTVYLSTSDLKSVGIKLIKTNTERVSLEFNTKEQMEKCLRFLYNFDKGEGYYIDLENKSNNMVMSLKNGFIVGALDQIDKPAISKYLIGKLLNSIGLSIKKSNDKNKKEQDDMYTNSSSLF
ncbi:hypothetical protein [Prevotella corporis]|uniref:hypothetical protein n=1 Tax=Prevotella corporis TaxID=28128 RepID=UPI000404E857|nr:hypothetical protein [Prevotella corporis]